MARAGGAWWDYKVKATPSTGFGAENDKITPTLGIGLEYKWFTIGYGVILDVGQENLLVPTAPKIKQTVGRLSAGLKLRF